MKYEQVIPGYCKYKIVGTQIYFGVDDGKTFYVGEWRSNRDYITIKKGFRSLKTAREFAFKFAQGKIKTPE